MPVHKDGDAVNHPPHYNSHPSGIEAIEVVRHHNFNVGSAIKYLWRAGLKDSEPSIRDLSKAVWYLNDEIARLSGGTGDAPVQPVPGGDLRQPHGSSDSRQLAPAEGTDGQAAGTSPSQEVNGEIHSLD